MQAYDDLKHYETPYVVKLHRFTPLAATQQVFTFEHPNFLPQIDNSRSCTLMFERRNQPAAVCHGFAGYFDAELYGSVSFASRQQSTLHMRSCFSPFRCLTRAPCPSAVASVSQAHIQVLSVPSLRSTLHPLLWLLQVHLSTHPPTHTPDMFSWFPIYFPLKEPVHCPAGAPICMSMWRCTAYHKVWYEWAVSQPAVTHIHNPTGRSYYVGL